MAKYSKKTSIQNRAQTITKKKVADMHASQKTSTMQQPGIQWLAGALGLRSILIAGAVGLIIYVSLTQNPGYTWAWQSYLKGNYDFICKYPNATLDERLQMKLGFDYSFLHYINQNTPEDAVILFPDTKHITEKAGNMQLSDNVVMKMWVTHFVYPRRILYANEAETNPLYKDVTHVAICAGHGYEKLEYSVENRPAFIVLPQKANY